MNLAAVQVGENSSSSVYLKSQKKTTELLGIGYTLHTLAANTSQEELIEFIKKLNEDEEVTAMIIQLPLPEQIDGKLVTAFTDPVKDAEGMHPANLGKVVLANYKIAPCTPLALMLLKEFATTTICHIATGERGLLPEHTKRAEILVVAVGKAGLVKGGWVKEGAVVVDVGINKVGDKIVGDVEFEKASERASFITPVPGGVGPLTVTMLMRNVVESYKIQNT